METSLTEKRRRASVKRKKKGGKALARLRSLKGEPNEESEINGGDISGASVNDRGFRDVRTLTEKMRLVSWVDSTSCTFTDLDISPMHIMKMDECL
jgi:hypothetical protein